MAEEKYTGFEKQLKNSLEEYEVAYDPAAWESMEQKLDASAFKAKLGKAALIAAGIALVGGITLYSIKDNTINEEQAGKTTIVQNNLPEDAASTTKNDISSNEKSLTEDKAVTEANEEMINSSSNNNIEEKTSNVENKEEESSTESSNTNNNSTENSSKESDTEEKIENNNTTKEKENINEEEIAYNTLSANFTIESNSICAGENVKLYAEDKSAKNYIWDMGDGNTIKGKAPQYTYNSAGIYNIKLTVEDSKGSKVSQSLPNAVTVHKLPVADFDWEKPVQDLTKAPAIAFTNKSFDAVRVSWDFGNGKSSNEKSPQQIYTKKGTYSVTLTVTNSFGCRDSKVQMIEADGYNLLAPTGFSPNGDGYNDTWIPVALKHLEADFTVKVFDKSGQLVFVTSNKSNEWNGRKLNGQLAAPGETFGWVAVVKDSTGTTQEYAGSVTIK